MTTAVPFATIGFGAHVQVPTVTLHYLGVPVTVVDDDSISSSECDALSTSPCRQQEDEAVCISCTDRHKL